MKAESTFTEEMEDEVTIDARCSILSVQEEKASATGLKVIKVFEEN